MFIASCSATFIFAWGLLGYVILRRLNQGAPPNQPNIQMNNRLQSSQRTRNSGAALSQDIRENGGSDRQVVERHHASTADVVGLDRNDDSDSRSRQVGALYPVDSANGTQEWEEKWKYEMQDKSGEADIGSPHTVSYGMVSTPPESSQI